MRPLLIVGAGLFGSQAAAYARSKGIEVKVFDPGLAGAASPAAAGLFQEAWVSKKLKGHFRTALPVLERLYEVRHVPLTRDDGSAESLLFVPPRAILERNPIRAAVTAIGDGWLEAEGQRHDGFVYIAAGVWCRQFVPSLQITGKAGSAFLFEGEAPGRIRVMAANRQAIAFVRDPGKTYFSDGTAEVEFQPEHDEASLTRARGLGLAESPIARLHGVRPYTPGGPLFQRLSSRSWVATGGRKMGTLLGAFYARQLIERELILT
jgi:glycine/D-amino acid oxidase-like deaminating enzyme